MAIGHGEPDDYPSICWQIPSILCLYCYTIDTGDHGASSYRSLRPLPTGSRPRDPAMLYVFGDCALDTNLYALHRAGQSIRPRPKVFQVLIYLLAHRERVVSRQELCGQVWPDQFISDAALESAIRRARQAIGDSGRAQQLIQTLHGHGYRFIAAVTVRPEACPDSKAEAAPPLPAPGTKPVQDPTDARPPLIPPAVSARSAVSSPSDDAARMLPSPDALAGERKMITILGCTLVYDPAPRDRLRLDTL